MDELQRLAAAATGSTDSPPRRRYASASPRSAGWSTAEKWAVTLAIVLALVGGYFAGREHLKYEIKSTLMEAGRAIQKDYEAKMKRMNERQQRAE